MDHFFLCICRGEFSAEENLLIVDYINSLLPRENNFEYYLNVSNHIAPLLRPATTHIAILNCCQELNDNIIWNEVNKPDLISGCISALQEKKPSNVEDLVVDSQLLSAFINSLADQLPIQGSYKLDVIISYEVLRDSSVSEYPELASSFYRLVRWHGMYSAVLISKEPNSNIFQQWCEIMNAEILQHKISQGLSSVLWRGSLQLQVSNTSEKVCCSGLELRLDLLENEMDLLSTCASASLELDDQFSKHVVLSPTLHAMDECNFASIPPYMKLPLVFRLCISKSSILNESTSSLVKYLSCRREAALIIKMDFSLLNEKPKSEKLLCTNKWKKAVSSSCITCPEPSLSSFQNHGIFAVTLSHKSTHLVAYSLRDPNTLNANFYFNIIDSMNLKALQCHNVTENVNCNYVETLKKLHVLNTQAFYFYLEKMKQLKRLSTQEQNSLIDDSNSSLNISSFNECINENLCSIENKNTISDFHWEEIDPSDWPERIYLLQKQIREEGDRITLNQNAFTGLGSKLSHYTAVFSSEDIRKLFESSGDSKKLTNTEVISSQKDMRKFVKTEFNMMLQKQWPEVLDIFYDDIYYNTHSQAEEKESIGNQMVQLYVQHETASTCNNQQLVTNSSVPLTSTEHIVNEKKWRSPSFRKKHLLNMRTKSENNISFENKSNMTDIIKKNLISSTRTINANKKISSKDFPNEKISNKCASKKKCSNKVSMPIRSSPRKKVNANSKISSALKDSKREKSSNIKKASVLKPNELPELQKKKLRVAVASALESQGINLGDAFFKPCGKRLFAICQAFVQDISQRKGSTSQHMKKIADAHVKQVIEFERQKESGL